MKTKQSVRTTQAPAAIGPYSQGVIAGGLLFVSGQLSLDPTTKKLVGDTAAEQTEQVMHNIGAILRAAGCDYPDVVKTSILLVDIADFIAVNEIYGRYFPVDPPARATYQVAALPMGARVEIEAVALVNSER